MAEPEMVELDMKEPSWCGSEIQIGELELPKV
jgi:hypothetical protein